MARTLRLGVVEADCLLLRLARRHRGQATNALLLLPPLRLDARRDFHIDRERAAGLVEGERYAGKRLMFTLEY